ncbi:hypothetical protein Leryth_021852 [Lithospermum erythrorhizon]|nr:hypothetical protein Leryth_021852 [Lithospermum erythrorhizon]
MSTSFSPSTYEIKNSPLASLPFPQTYMHAANGGNEYVCLRLQMKHGHLGRFKCAKSGIVPELEDDIKLEEELIGIGDLKEKCRESNGMVELLECLEREAIMGDDQGREATDYNKRAHIFDKSSRVFQAIKERENAQE